MSDFLEFLNTADSETLQKTAGITPALAERISAARPFASLEDCQRISGLGEKLLQRLQDSFNQASDQPVPPALPVALEVSRPAPQAQHFAPAPQPKLDFGQRLGRAFMGLLKFLSILLISAIILGGIGAALYIGLPYLYEIYVVPVNQNTTRISELVTQQAQDVTALKAEITELQLRLTEAEQQRVSLEASLAAHTLSLAKLEEMQTTLNTTASEQRQGLNAELSRQIKLTRAIEILSRARLYLSQSNFGQARADVQSAYDLLAQLQTELAQEQQLPLNAVLARLNLALGNLPDFPVIAVDDLDIAWNLLINDLPDGVESAEITPTATP